ncbi:uncharacterized protein RJT20DRAFT_129887 [Scheffersomyces xylosifermentans]|uniref:uncharacterized protein n=1 Tax=Scheffersomyces xylosifermentans TaxID=1304137 RepID=UPI00315D30B8
MIRTVSARNRMSVSSSPHSHAHHMSKRYNSKQAMLIPSQLNTLLQTDKFVKYHYSSLGCDLVKLKSYPRFKHLIVGGGGGIVKELVFDLTSFIRKELTDSKNDSSQQLKDFLTSNGSILNSEDAMTFSDHHLALRNWLYIIFGYLSQAYREDEVEKVLDKIIDMYLAARNKRLFVRSASIPDAKDSAVLELIKNYYETVSINYDKLYNIDESRRYIMFHETQDMKVYLPPLPKVHNRELLVKALMHKEYYRMLLIPKHSFAKKLTELGYDLDPREYSVLKYELSFLDGLGDLFLAHESSKLIYDLCKEGTKYVSNNTYHMLRTILATNTLLSKLTVTYNLHHGLDDAVVADRLANDYLLCLHTGRLHPDMDADETRVYEEEFLGDYFESYMAALVLEQPEVAERFIAEIYSSILQVITKVLPPDVSYRIWTTGILGRNLHHK